MLSLQEQAKVAPHSPGVYIFKNSNGTPIYIGKAKDLKNRLLHYFSKNANDRVKQMISSANYIEYIITDNETEALILENSLIKKHYPKYNLDLRESEKYTYILITDEPFPRMLLIRKDGKGKINKKGTVYGPFVSGSAHVLVASTLRKIFKIRTCKLNQKRPCLQYHLGFCTGVCAGLVKPEEYAKQVEMLKTALSGGKPLEELISSLKREMASAAKKKDFERAIELRNSIKALSALAERQKMESESEDDADFIAHYVDKDRIHVQMFRQVRGVIKDRKKFELEAIITDEPLDEFLIRFYDTEQIPNKIYVEKKFATKEALEKYLTQKRGKRVSIIVPERGDKKDVLELLQKNIQQDIYGSSEQSILELQRILSLPAVPRVIECFDVSNLQGSTIVGGMVQFINGKPNKSAYRRYKIKTVESQNDFASIEEVVFRRYYRLKNEGKKMPDFILIDGGAGQLSSALAALKRLELEIPVAAIAKKFDEIYMANSSSPIALPRSSQALKLLQFLRDEAHRFCLAYHRKAREKGIFKPYQN